MRIVLASKNNNASQADAYSLEVFQLRHHMTAAEVRFMVNHGYIKRGLAGQANPSEILMEELSNGRYDSISFNRYIYKIA